MFRASYLVVPPGSQTLPDSGLRVPLREPLGAPEAFVVPEDRRLSSGLRWAGVWWYFAELHDPAGQLRRWIAHR